MKKKLSLLMLLILATGTLPSHVLAQACAPNVKAAIEDAATKHFTEDRDLIKGAIRTTNVSVLNYACFSDGIARSGLYYFTTAAPSAAANESVQQYLGKGLTTATSDCINVGDLESLTTAHEQKFKDESFKTPFSVDYIKTSAASVAFTSHFNKINPGSCGAKIPSGVVGAAGSPEYFCSNPNCVYRSGDNCTAASGT